MRTRRHRNKTKNNRKRGGALGRGVTVPPTGTIRSAVEGVRNFTRKFTCCRPGQRPNDGDGVAAAAGVGPALPPPGSPPFIRRARGSPGSPGSRGASCVPCPQGSSRPPSRPLPPIPRPPPPLTGPPSLPLPLTPRPISRSPSRSSSSRPSSRSSSSSRSPSRSSSGSRPSSRSSRSRSVSPTELIVSDVLQIPVSSVPSQRASRLDARRPEHMQIIQSCMLSWQAISAIRRERLHYLLDRFMQLDSQIKVKVQAEVHKEKWSHLRKSVREIMKNIKQTAQELLRCKMSIRFWTDASQGTAEVQYPTGSLSDAVKTRIFKQLPPQYVSKLRAEIEGLPIEVNSSNLQVFRSL